MKPGTPRLITIPISHYCEKARWALDRASIPYREERHLQIFHILAAMRANRQDEVPILVLGESVLGDSTDILKWASGKMSEDHGLYPNAMKSEVEEFEDFLDEGLGVAARLWAYSHLLHEPTGIARRYSRTYGAPKIQSFLFPIAFPLIKKLIARALEVTPERGMIAQKEIDEVFSVVGKRLESGGKYLFGDRFTAADLTFASLSAPVLLPSQYGVELPKVHELPRVMREKVEAWRDHPAGRFALRLYQEERR